MRPFAAGVACLLATVPWSARAQDESPSGSNAPPVVEGTATATPEPPAEQTQGLEDRERAQEEKWWADSQPVQAPPPPGRRRFGLGLAAGAGLILPPSWISAWFLGLRDHDSLLAGQLPSVEARFFLENGMSLDLSALVGDIIGRLARGRRWASMTSEVFWNFNVQCGPGIYLLLGPGLGASLGEVDVPAFFTYPSIGGEVRLGLQTGVEFLTAGGHLGIALSVRPRVGFYAWVDENNSLQAAFIGGVMGLMSVNYYFLAR